MTSRRNALGRGIGALIPRAPAVADARSVPADDSSAEIPLDAIQPNPDQPRRRFEAAELDQLAESIRRHGVIQPVVVRRRTGQGPVRVAGPESYELVVGERRWRAARAAGLDAIPAVIADVAGDERLEVALVENVQRSDLNPIELALAFRALGESGATQEEIGERVGLDRSTVANHVRLLELPRELQEDVEQRQLTAGHAKALLQVANPERRRHLRDRIVAEGLSVRAAEELARRLAGQSSGKRRARPVVDPNLQRVVDALRQRLQTRVRIQGAPARGRIEIEYFGVDDLNRITGVLLGDG